MEKLETIKEIKSKIEKGIKLNASESAVLIDVIEPHCNSESENKVIRLKNRIEYWKKIPNKEYMVNELTIIMKQTKLLISIENLRNAKW